MKKLLVRFGGWMAAFTALYGASSVCPVCGQAVCPVGLAGAGLVGAACAFVATAAGKIASRKSSPPPESAGDLEEGPEKAGCLHNVPSSCNHCHD